MIDHITIGVANFARSTAFYDQVCAPLGVSRLITMTEDGVDIAGYGDTQPWLWLVAERPTTGLLHVALRAPNRTSVDGFHAAAIAAGGMDNGAPGLRPHYHPDYYAAFVQDPDGHNIKAVCHSPQAPTQPK
ncbi:VOC family protein [uncultured Tateyamaria sp.]|uniref:VOC family protein n=1 Tax=uncultured Tateyamaria sp. TaxID=455651 RepID=UPI002619682D|nr:VOC family protein [uncultured Tateyamaria sp.]